MIREELPCDCCFSFTVQEEVGCFGGKTAAYTLRPDIAVAVETTTAGDLAGVPEERKVCRLGQGPVVSFMDRGTIYTYDLYKKVRALADENGDLRAEYAQPDGYHIKPDGYSVWVEYLAKHT